ncbi:hypothetical protein HK102_000838, partial [Quaeritorhiza haematococci]
AVKTWIYPTNKPLREYQFTIVQQSLTVNTLVALPTGLGKTFIASVVMFNFFRWLPEGKIVFMAPTKPLVAQQIEACYQITGLPGAAMVELTGSTSPTERERLWDEKRVFFLTPQVLQNDLKSAWFPANRLVLLVVDEAHRATGNHAYCEVIRLLDHHGAKKFRVLALTATPGAQETAVQEVIKNLLISRIEIRTEDSVDIRPYIHTRRLEVVVVKLSPEVIAIRDQLGKVLNIFLERLVRAQAFYERNADKVTKFTLLLAKQRFQQKLRHDDDAQKWRSAGVMGDFAIAMMLSHAYSLLIQHGIRSCIANLKANLEEITERGAKKSVAQKELLNNPDLRNMLTSVSKQMETPLFISHPKLERLVGVVVQHFVDCQEASAASADNTRVMVFSQYRESVEEIVKMLSEHSPMIRVMSFVGQSSGKKSGKGFTQKEQIQVIQKFQSGNFNVLVATSIGEEGLDIGEVDLIICYDAQNSPIRMLQRIGRTGRKRAGRVVVLVTEGREQKAYAESQTKYKSVQKAITMGQGEKFKMFPTDDARMIPPGVNPVCVKMDIEVPTGEVRAFARGGSMTRQRSYLGRAGSGVGAAGGALAAAGAGSSTNPFLTDEEMEDYIKNIRMPLTTDEDVMADLVDAEPEGTDTAAAQDILLSSFDQYIHWQTNLLPERPHTGNAVVRRSKRTAAFVECVNILEEICYAEKEEREEAFGEEEMTRWLNMNDVVVDADDDELDHGKGKGKGKGKVISATRSAKKKKETAVSSLDKQKKSKRKISILAEPDSDDDAFVGADAGKTRPLAEVDLEDDEEAAMAQEFSLFDDLLHDQRQQNELGGVDGVSKKENDGETEGGHNNDNDVEPAGPEELFDDGGLDSGDDMDILPSLTQALGIPSAKKKPGGGSDLWMKDDGREAPLTDLKEEDESGDLAKGKSTAVDGWGSDGNGNSIFDDYGDYDPAIMSPPLCDGGFSDSEGQDGFIVYDPDMRLPVDDQCDDANVIIDPVVIPSSSPPASVSKNTTATATTNTTMATKMKSVHQNVESSGPLRSLCPVSTLLRRQQQQQPPPAPQPPLNGCGVDDDGARGGFGNVDDFGGHDDIDDFDDAEFAEFDCVFDGWVPETPAKDIVDRMLVGNGTDCAMPRTVDDFGGETGGGQTLVHKKDGGHVSRLASPTAAIPDMAKKHEESPAFVDRLDHDFRSLPSDSQNHVGAIDRQEDEDGNEEEEPWPSDPFCSWKHAVRPLPRPDGVKRDGHGSEPSSDTWLREVGDPFGFGRTLFDELSFNAAEVGLYTDIGAGSSRTREDGSGGDDDARDAWRTSTLDIAVDNDIALLSKFGSDGIALATFASKTTTAATTTRASTDAEKRVEGKVAGQDRHNNADVYQRGRSRIFPDAYPSMCQSAPTSAESERDVDLGMSSDTEGRGSKRSSPGDIDESYHDETLLVAPVKRRKRLILEDEGNDNECTVAVVGVEACHVGQQQQQQQGQEGQEPVLAATKGEPSGNKCVFKTPKIPVPSKARRSFRTEVVHSQSSSDVQSLLEASHRQEEHISHKSQPSPMPASQDCTPIVLPRGRRKRIIIEDDSSPPQLSSPPIMRPHRPEASSSSTSFNLTLSAKSTQRSKGTRLQIDVIDSPVRPIEVADDSLKTQSSQERPPSTRVLKRLRRGRYLAKAAVASLPTNAMENEKEIVEEVNGDNEDELVAARAEEEEGSSPYRNRTTKTPLLERLARKRKHRKPPKQRGTPCIPVAESSRNADKMKKPERRRQQKRPTIQKNPNPFFDVEADETDSDGEGGGYARRRQTPSSDEDEVDDDFENGGRRRRRGDDDSMCLDGDLSGFVVADDWDSPSIDTSAIKRKGKGRRSALGVSSTGATPMDGDEEVHEESPNMMAIYHRSLLSPEYGEARMAKLFGRSRYAFDPEKWKDVDDSLVDDENEEEDDYYDDYDDEVEEAEEVGFEDEDGVESLDEFNDGEEDDVEAFETTTPWKAESGHKKSFRVRSVRNAGDKERSLQKRPFESALPKDTWNRMVTATKAKVAQSPNLLEGATKTGFEDDFQDFDESTLLEVMNVEDCDDALGNNIRQQQHLNDASPRRPCSLGIEELLGLDVEDPPREESEKSRIRAPSSFGQRERQQQQRLNQDHHDRFNPPSLPSGPRSSMSTAMIGSGSGGQPRNSFGFPVGPLNSAGSGSTTSSPVAEPAKSRRRFCLSSKLKKTNSKQNNYGV